MKNIVMFGVAASAWLAEAVSLVEMNTPELSFSTEGAYPFRTSGESAPNGGPVVRATMPAGQSATLRVDVAEKGFLSYYYAPLAMNYWSYRLAVLINGEEAFEHCAATREGWTDRRLCVEAGGSTVQFEWGPSRYWNTWWSGGEDWQVMLGGFSFEPYGPQKTFGEWLGKLDGYKCWVAGDLPRFQQEFAKAKTPKALVLHALTTVGTALENKTVVETFARFGMAVDFFHFGRAQSRLAGSLRFDNPVSGNDVVDRALAVGEPLLKTAIADLEALSPTFDPFLMTSEDMGNLDEDVCVDRGDVLYLCAAFKAMLGFAYYAKGYDMDVDYAALEADRQIGLERDKWSSMAGVHQTRLAAKVRNTAALKKSQTFVKEALTLMREADRAVQRRSDPRLHFIEYDSFREDDWSRLQYFRDNIDSAIESVDCGTRSFTWLEMVNAKYRSPEKLVTGPDPISINLNSVFSGKPNRSMLMPTASDLKYVPDLDQMKDPTFGGVFPTFTTAAQWASFFGGLRKVNGKDFVFTGKTPEPDPEPEPSGDDFVMAAAQYDAVVRTTEGQVVGLVQVKAAKPNVKTRVVKLSGSFTGLDGKKITLKQVEKNLVVPSSGPVAASFTVKGYADTLSVSIGGTELSGLLGDLVVTSGSIGGTVPLSVVRIDCDALDGISGEVQEDLLPGEVVFDASAKGKWTFTKAASVKLAKDKVTKEQVLVVDESKGRTNKSGLKLTYTPKTGLFKGSFSLYALETKGAKMSLKKYSVSVSGVVVDGRGQGVATLKKPACSWSVSIE